MHEKNTGFFGSKLNTALLLILIVLMITAIHIMLQNKEMYFPVFSEQTTRDAQTDQSTIESGYQARDYSKKISEKEFSFNYDSNANISPLTDVQFALPLFVFPSDAKNAYKIEYNNQPYAYVFYLTNHYPPSNYVCGTIESNGDLVEESESKTIHTLNDFKYCDFKNPENIRAVWKGEVTDGEGTGNWLLIVENKNYQYIDLNSIKIN